MGQIGHILPTVPLFLGEASREVARILYRRLSRCAGLDVQPVLSALERAHTFQPGRTLTIGNIRITPLLVDHSAFDAYMFLLESDGVRLLYTGDFRNHGPRGKALLPVLRRYVGQVDWLICEGTTLSRPQGRVLTEWELGSRARAVMQAHRHVFVLCASTNIDRIATLAHCAPRGRPVICDGYQKEILNCVEKLSGSKSGFYRFDRVIPYFAGTTSCENGWKKRDSFRLSGSTGNFERGWTPTVGTAYCSIPCGRDTGAVLPAAMNWPRSWRGFPLSASTPAAMPSRRRSDGSAGLWPRAAAFSPSMVKPRRCFGR